MKKIVLVLFMFFTLALTAKDIEGDASGNDLNPILRGFNLNLNGGVVSFIGKAGDNAAKTGSVFGMGIGYNLKIAENMDLGFSANIGIMQIDADVRELGIFPDSPWKEDYAPLIPGADIYFNYLLTSRFEIGMNLSLDYMMKAKVYKKNSIQTTDTLLSIGGGLNLEYYTYARHFSVGLKTEFFYILDFDGINIQVTPFVKYSF
jgi:hypothetical protein